MSHLYAAHTHRRIGIESMHRRHLRTLEVGVAEAPNQQATFRGPIPATEEALTEMENRIMSRAPTPCCEQAAGV